MRRKDRGRRFAASPNSTGTWRANRQLRRLSPFAIILAAASVKSSRSRKIGRSVFGTMPVAVSRRPVIPLILAGKPGLTLNAFPPALKFKLDADGQITAESEELLPRSYHHGNLKEVLLETARKLIEQYGPAGFSLTEAARLTGVSPAAPYRHPSD